ncbi:MAG TPA: hypothetical protein VJT73_08625, partial [Polyangiaceae bacterium]|nr:hypothetical protein [Polyangiaceae bacterium]
DVADLESEALHDYWLGPTRETENKALSFEHGERTIADGARVRRSSDHFVLHGRGRAGVLVARLVSDEDSASPGGAPPEVEASTGGASLGKARLRQDGWTEAEWEIPALAGDVEVVVTALSAARFGSAHYWLYMH